MRPDRVVQQGLRTPTGPSFGSCCIRGIHGLRIGIHEAIERPGGVVFRCDLTASDAKHWLEIPAWMFDRSACAKVRLAVEPHTDLSALVMLGALLRDGRDWQQLIEMCRVVDTVLVDQETVYAPRHGNDRLLLGLKGSLNEYELDLLRQRSLRQSQQAAYARSTPSNPLYASLAR